MKTRIHTRITNWRIDEDGMLRVTAHVLKEGVYAYSARESGTETLLPGVNPVMQYIPRCAFTPRALDSLEGKPVTVPRPFVRSGGGKEGPDKDCGDVRAAQDVTAPCSSCAAQNVAAPCSSCAAQDAAVSGEEEWHQWRDADNALADGLTVGSIAGRPTVTADGCIECDMLILDAETIARVTSGELVEVSAGYDGVLDIVEGRHGGRHYDAVQGDFHFNHILLLPAGTGRCGPDVRIINSRAAVPSVKHSEGANMPTTLKVTVGNKARSYKFHNEEDAALAEDMLKEEQVFNAEAGEAALAGKAELEDRISALQARLDEVSAQLEAARQELETVQSPAAREAAAAEFSEQKEAEQAIVDVENSETGGGEPEKEEFTKALKACNSLAARRALTVTRVMNRRGVNVDGWTQDAFDGAFRVMAMEAAQAARARSKDTAGRILNGRQTPGKGGDAAGMSPRDRVLKPMQARNARPESK